MKVPIATLVALPVRFQEKKINFGQKLKLHYGRKILLLILLELQNLALVMNTSIIEIVG